MGDVAQRLSVYPALGAPVRVSLTMLGAHACPYLPGRVSTSRAFLTKRLDPLLYHAFMDAGFRRSGRLIYQPVCAGCRACVPVRVPVDRFVHSKSQRRCWRRNADLRVEVGLPAPTAEKFELYRRYTTGRHDDQQPTDLESFLAFLYESPVDTLEFVYRDAAGQLLAVGICDVCASSLSSVYFYFDPEEEKRGLGTYSALWEIEYARREKIPHYYLGYWIKGAPTMEYKANFRPNELLNTDGIWRADGS
ncbi:MAG TPA: arginyltransferase [Tepidisphaeraceae bacterium]